MKKILSICCCLILYCAAVFSQNPTHNDTTIAQQTPVLMKQSLLFSTNMLGWSMSVGKLLKQKEFHRFKKSGYEKIVTKNRILYGTIGYFHQPKFQDNWSLTAEYAMTRRNKNGFYSEFTPFLGVSRAFLPASTYTVGDNGTVTKENLAGSWYLTGGFSTGLGKAFDATKGQPLKTLSAKFVLQGFYPNFKFVAIKPYFQLSSAWGIPKFHTHSVKTVKYKS